MIVADLGSKVIKWFDGKAFGTGEPPARPAVVGISSSSLLVKESYYPICRGQQLKKLITSDVTSELSVEPDKITFTFCRVGKEDKGCKFLILVEKREVLDNLPLFAKESRITSDLIGGAAGALSLYGEDVSVVDLGASKVALFKLVNGKISEVEIFRGSYSFNLERESFKEALSRLKGERVVLVGGGALDEKAVSEITNLIDAEIPQFEPFGKEAPLYFNAFGLTRLKSLPCKAFFKDTSLFLGEFFKKNKKTIALGSALGIASLLLLSGAEFINYISLKRDYIEEKKAFKKYLTEITGEKILAPEIQIPQLLEKLKKKEKFLLLDSPPLLFLLNRISESVKEGIDVYKVEGDLRKLQIEGYAKKQENLDSFVGELKKKFNQVTVNSSKETRKGIKFTITVSGVSVE